MWGEGGEGEEGWREGGKGMRTSSPIGKCYWFGVRGKKFGGLVGEGKDCGQGERAMRLSNPRIQKDGIGYGKYCCY